MNSEKQTVSDIVSESQSKKLHEWQVESRANEITDHRAVSSRIGWGKMHPNSRKERQEPGSMNPCTSKAQLVCSCQNSVLCSFNMWADVDPPSLFLIKIYSEYIDGIFSKYLLGILNFIHNLPTYIHTSKLQKSWYNWTWCRNMVNHCKNLGLKPEQNQCIQV